MLFMVFWELITLNFDIKSAANSKFCVNKSLVLDLLLTDEFGFPTKSACLTLGLLTRFVAVGLYVQELLEVLSSSSQGIEPLLLFLGNKGGSLDPARDGGGGDTDCLGGGAGSSDGADADRLGGNDGSDGDRLGDNGGDEGPALEDWDSFRLEGCGLLCCERGVRV